VCSSDLLGKEVVICKDTCFLEDRCIEIGTRIRKSYCDKSGRILTQIKPKQDCNENYMCDSNICNEGKCIEQNIIEKIISFFTGLF
jgi:hypothetical protein